MNERIMGFFNLSADIAETMNFDTVLDFISHSCSFTKASNVNFSSQPFPPFYNLLRDIMLNELYFP